MKNSFHFFTFFLQTFAFTARKWIEENSTYLTSLYYQTIEDTEATALTADQNFNVSEFAWDPTSTVLAFTRSDNKSVLYTIDITVNGSCMHPARDLNHTLFSDSLFAGMFALFHRYI